MDEKLEQKIEDVLNYIINKPVEEIRPEEFMILTGELKERRFRKESEKQRDRSAEFLRHFMDSSPFGYIGN